MTDPQGNLLDRIKSAYGVYPPVDPLLRDAHDLIERLQRDSRELRQTLDYARDELRKADRRAADFAKRSEERMVGHDGRHFFTVLENLGVEADRLGIRAVDSYGNPASASDFLDTVMRYIIARESKIDQLDRHAHRLCDK
jgi:hypothetical protein